LSHRKKKRNRKQRWQRRSRKLLGGAKSLVKRGTGYLQAQVRKAQLKKKARAMKAAAIMRKYGRSDSPGSATGRLLLTGRTQTRMIANEAVAGIAGPGTGLARIGFKGIAAGKAAVGLKPTVLGRAFPSKATSSGGKALVRAVGGSAIGSVIASGLVETVRGITITPPSAQDIGDIVPRLIDRFKPTAVNNGRAAVRTVGGELVPRVSRQQVLLDYGRYLSGDEFFQAYGYAPKGRRRSYRRSSRRTTNNYYGRRRRY